MSAHMGNLPFAQLFSAGVQVKTLITNSRLSGWILTVTTEDWGKAATAAVDAGIRFSGIWADQQRDGLIVFALLEYAGDYLLLKTGLASDNPCLPSLANCYPGAARLERHIHDMFGIRFEGHPDLRRWTRHQAWAEDQYPLLAEFSPTTIAHSHTPADKDYSFLKIDGAGVYEIPVGPVHAGIIEPGHFRFQAVGEDVLNLEERLGYVHKGIEKIAVGRTPEGLARLAGRVSGDTTVAHSWAACQAMESASRCAVPPRALSLRAVMSERERIANHLGDIGAICNDVGFTFAHMQFARLREDWQRRSGHIFGHRLLMDRVVPGGVAVDVDESSRSQLLEDHHTLRSETRSLFDIITDHPSLEDRLVGAGRLVMADAHRLGALGYVGKASGHYFDLRRDHPYAPYNTLDVAVPMFTDGDIAARMRVRIDEITISLTLMDTLLGGLPEGPVITLMADPLPQAYGVGLIEGWRGEIVTYLRFDDNGRIARYFPRDPSWFNWPALEILIRNNIVPDFPVCNKSVNCSYSAHDL